jgi:hypothetical protein
MLLLHVTKYQNDDAFSLDRSVQDSAIETMFSELYQPVFTTLQCYTQIMTAYSRVLGVEDM